MKQLVFRVDKHGKVSSEGMGYVGEHCLKDLEQFLVRGLGETSSVELKEEYYTVQHTAKLEVDIG